MSLALNHPRMVLPSGQYAPRPPDGILVLQRGENASTDYYLRPRLEAAGAPAEVADLAQDPRSSKLLGPGGAKSLMVVFCRYASPDWLAALERSRDRLSRVVLFMDDDLPAMMRAQEIPAAARGKVALHFGAHVDRLGSLCSEVWVSTEALAARYPAARPQELGALPEADPPEPKENGDGLVVYHGTDVHDRERRFVVEVARLVAAQTADARFEISGGPALARTAAGAPRMSIVPQLPWPEYLAVQRGRRAGISLAPLFASPLNDVRAPVKAFDAARLGAAGIYADAPAYRDFIRHGEDGLVLPMDPAAWASAIVELLADPGRRLRLAMAAHDKLAALLKAERGFPAPPAE